MACPAFKGAPRTGENAMAIYISLGHFTEKGLHDVKETVKRFEAFKSLAKKHGVTVKENFWTQGAYDMVTVLEAADDAAVSSLALSVAKLGNIRGHTLRGFTAAEMQKIVNAVD
jgi:uncharacterized protein with GYD domain